MCGIVGVIGEENVGEALLEGLSRLEYRGYDSSGIAVRKENDEIITVKSKGKLHFLFLQLLLFTHIPNKKKGSYHFQVDCHKATE